MWCCARRRRASGAAPFDRASGCGVIRSRPGCAREAKGCRRRGAEDNRAPLGCRASPQSGATGRLSCAPLTRGIRAASVATARDPAQTLLCARHAVTRCSSFHPSVAGSLQRDVRAPCFATSAAGGIRKVSHGGSDLPKVAGQVCVSAEARPPLTPLPAITPAAATRGYVAQAQGWY